MSCTGRTSATKKDGGWGARPESKDVREMNGAKHKTANSSQTGCGGNPERKMVHSLQNDKTGKYYVPLFSHMQRLLSRDLVHIKETCYL